MFFLEDNIRRNHNIIVEDRKKMTLTGVKDVLSFDEETVVLDTYLGRLTIKGTGLHIMGFDTNTGDLIAEGKIYALVYTAEEKSGGIFSRIFK